MIKGRDLILYILNNELEDAVVLSSEEGNAYEVDWNDVFSQVWTWSDDTETRVLQIG